MLQNPHILLTFDKVHNPVRLPRETTSERPKVVRACGVFHILTSKCASRHNGVHFFNISTSKSGPDLVCFVHFDLEMCFTPQRRALFSTSQLPKVVRTWCVLYIFTWKCASRHNGVHFFDIATSKSALNLVCFIHFDFEMCFAPQRRALFRHLNFKKCSEREVSWAVSLANVLRATKACNCSSLIWPVALASLLFDPPKPQIIGKTQCFATFLPFRVPGSSFFWDFLFCDLLFSALLFSSRLLSSPLFSSLLFFDSSHLCFSSVHIVGSLTSKLPSITHKYFWMDNKDYCCRKAVSSNQVLVNCSHFINGWCKETEISMR